MRKPHLFRWWRCWQLDAPCRGGWLSLGLDWTAQRWRPVVIAYWSPDATPMHKRARGWRP